jgi:hypothetical protein
MTNTASNYKRLPDSLFEVNGKPAVRIHATVICYNPTKTAVQLDCEGDKEWFPMSTVKINQTQGTVLIQEWKYNQAFPK